MKKQSKNAQNHIGRKLSRLQMQNTKGGVAFAGNDWLNCGGISIFIKCKGVLTIIQGVSATCQVGNNSTTMFCP